MNKRLRWSLVLMIFTVFFSTISIGAINPFVPVMSNPTVNYKIVSTSYMNVVYGPGCEYAVSQFLRYGDEMYRKITDFYDIQPFSKLTVVFENDTNIVNSLTDPVDNVIFVFLNSASKGFFSQNETSWVKFVFTHELTHILLTQAGGPKDLRVYGVPLSTAFNGLMIPAYLQEGLAEYTETAFNGGMGRLNDPLFEMYLRELVLSGRFKGLGGSINYSPAGWYPIGAPYMIGGSFVRYVADTYGATVLKKAVINLSGDHTAGVSEAFAKATGKPFGEMISEWVKNVRTETASSVRNIGNAFVGLQITQGGRWTGLVNSIAGNSLYYYSESDSTIPEIRKIDLSTMDDTGFYTLGGFVYSGTGYTRSIAVSPDGMRMAFTRFVPTNGGYDEKTHVFMMNTKTRSIEELPISGALSMAWLSDSRLAYVEESGALYSIKTYDTSTGTFGTILYPSLMVVTSMTSDGGNLYLSAKYEDTQNIYELDSSGLKRIVSGNFIMLDPAVSADGRYLIFSAAKPDRGGIFNLYALERSSGRFYRITNVVGGAFSPETSGSRLFYSGYTENGYNLFAIDNWENFLTPAGGFESVSERTDPSINQTQVFLSVDRESKPYSDSLQTIGSGVLPDITPNGTKLDYGLIGFGLFRDKLGQNNVYAAGMLSTNATQNGIIAGMVHFGRYVYSLSGTLTPSRLGVTGEISMPITGLLFERDLYFNPSLSYTVQTSAGTITDNFEFDGLLEWAPTFVPNNPSGVFPFYAQWAVNFSPINPGLPNYLMTLGTSFPMFGSVVSGGTEISNGGVTAFQSLSLPRWYVNLYYFTGQLGLRYMDLSQFSEYDFTTQNTRVGLKAYFGIDSVFNQTIRIGFSGYYDVKYGKFGYGMNFDF